METILGLLLMLLVVVVVASAIFLVFIQPIWGIVDVAVSKEHSNGTKAVIILVTLLCLGPIMTFFYAIFGSKSKALKSATLVSFLVLLLSGAVMLGLAIAVPVLKQKLPWWPGGGGTTPPPVTQESADADVEAGVDPDTLPSYTAVQLSKTGTGPWSAAIGEFNGHGPKSHSMLPVVLPSIYPLTHVAVDPKGPSYYGITTHAVGRIYPTTGKFEELKADPTGTKPSWPSAIAYDSKQELLLIAARSHGHSYHLKTGEWKTVPWLKDDGFVGLAYDSENEWLYALQVDNAGTNATTLLKFNAQGEVLSKTALSKPIAVGRYPSPLAQLAFAQGSLISTVFPSPEEVRAGASPSARTYLIDPQSGKTDKLTGKTRRREGGGAETDRK